MNHITNTELQEFVDRVLEVHRIQEVEKHLSICAKCSSRFAGFQRLENAVRRISPDRVSAGFTELVMAGLRLERRVGFARLMLANLLPLGIVAVVLVLLVGVFVDEESSQNPLSQQGEEYSQTFEQGVAEIISTGTTAVLEWTGELINLSNAIPFIKLIIGLVSAFVVVALFDEFIFLPMLKKK